MRTRADCVRWSGYRPLSSTTLDVSHCSESHRPSNRSMGQHILRPLTITLHPQSVIVSVIRGLLEETTPAGGKNRLLWLPGNLLATVRNGLSLNFEATSTDHVTVFGCGFDSEGKNICLSDSKCNLNFSVGSLGHSTLAHKVLRNGLKILRSREFNTWAPTSILNKFEPIRTAVS